MLTLKKRNLRHLLLAGLALALPAFAGTNTFRYYQAIEDAGAKAFMERGLSYARERLGEPRIPVQTAHLCQSTPLDPASTLRRQFQLCELSDPRQGVFTIYLSRKPAEYAFHGQLAHETAHLLNAQLYDVYVEGLNTVFAEKMIEKEGLDWSGWKTYLPGTDKFYGTTYAMMKEVWETTGDGPMKTFLAFAVFSDAARQKMHIAIDRWIDSLPADLRPKVRAVIAKHAPAVSEAMKLQPGSAFILPAKG